MTSRQDIETTLGDFVDRGLMLGAQLAVEQDGKPIFDVAVGVDGLRRPLTTSHRIQMRCAVCKPVLGATIAALQSEGLLDPDATLASILTDLPAGTALSKITFSDILTHSAGLHETSAVLLNMLSPDSRKALVRLLAPKPGWTVGVDQAYDVGVSWVFIGEVIEAVTGRAYDRVAIDHVLGPAGVADSMWLRIEERFFDQVRGRLAVGAGRVDDRPDPLPLLFEVCRLSACDWNPSWSGWSSAADLAHLYSWLLERREVDDPFGLALREATGTRRRGPSGPESQALGYGFVTELDLHPATQGASAGSFGHFGYQAAMGLADPARRVTVGFAAIGIPDELGAHFLVRAPVTELVWKLIDG